MTLIPYSRPSNFRPDPGRRTRKGISVSSALRARFGRTFFCPARPSYDCASGAESALRSATQAIRSRPIVDGRYIMRRCPGGRASALFSLVGILCKVVPHRRRKGFPHRRGTFQRIPRSGIIGSHGHYHNSNTVGVWAEMSRFVEFGTWSGVLLIHRNTVRSVQQVAHV